MSTPAERYLEAVHKGLADLPEEDIEEVLQDLAAHIAELGDIDPAAALGSPETFIAEFRTSAGLDGTGKRPSRIMRWMRARRDQLERARHRAAVILEPLIEPVARRRDELRTVWIWSRGAIALTAYSWVSNGSIYGTQRFFGTAGALSTASAYVAATVASVWIAGESRKWWRRADTVVSLAAVGLLLMAVASPRYVPYPDNNAYPESDPSMPVLLIGPNGPIQNLYAYDIDGQSRPGAALRRVRQPDPDPARLCIRASGGHCDDRRAVHLGGIRDPICHRQPTADRSAISTRSIVTSGPIPEPGRHHSLHPLSGYRQSQRKPTRMRAPPQMGQQPRPRRK